MKKVNFNKKLQLNKETVANLNESQMNDVKGGLTQRTQCGISCPPLCGVYTLKCVTFACISDPCHDTGTLDC